MFMNEESTTIRDIIGSFIGKTVVDITQHDQEEFDPKTGKGAYIMFLFDNGMTIQFPIGEEPFVYELED